ncbi:putative reverse transcriptase domain-containing protein [Tanacetum coccineum]
MSPRRTSTATARVAAAATRAAAAVAAAAPMIVAAVKQLIEARVSAALANHETLQNISNGYGDGSHNSDTGIRGTVRTPRECTYKDFLNCKPLTFKGTEGVVVLTQWFKKMESVFHISNCAMENQVKFATCTFLRNALTWWNSHMKTITQDVAYAVDWKVLKKMMTVKYCPRDEIKKLEIELWNLKVKGTDVASYTLRFQELVLMCGRMFPEESNEVEKYVGGLPDMIRGNIMPYQPNIMEQAIEFANDQMDQKILTISESQAEQKRKLEFNAGNNQGYQQQNKRQNTRRAYTVGPGVLVLMGHFKKDCPKLKNGNRGNRGGNGNAPAKVYVVGNAGTNLDSNVITGTFLLNDHYASILFDTGVDRSFVSTTFSSLIDITPTILDHYYDVELADGKIIGINTIIWGCTLNFLNHPFNINLMPVELGSFDSIIGMDWLSKYHAIIDCAEKIIRIPWPNKTIIIHGDRNKFVIVFIDDILIYSKNKKEHEEHLKAILELLKNKELYVKFSKCEFWIPKVQFLSHVIDSQGIHVDPAKIESIKDWASPKTPTKIQQFLGLASYYRRFIERFSKISKPITKLTQKEVAFE